MHTIDSLLYTVTKPARYTGGEWNSIIKDWDSTPIRCAVLFPDVYEIGMSNMAVPILYEMLNNQPDALAERAFAPWVDMEALMRKERIPLFSLETKHPLGEFDILGFSLGYELAYTNVLNMLDLSGIPVYARDRDDSCPLVVAGGGCALNPEPLSDFIDLFVVGECEEVLDEFLEVFRTWKKSGDSRHDLLRRAAAVSGIYVPALYTVDYNPDGTLKHHIPAFEDVPATVERRIAEKLAPTPVKPVVPFIETVHDRGAIEIKRGCTRGCRFCQAGMIYRPTRLRPQDEIVEAAGDILANCGYDELSLVSLSTSDYPGIENVVRELVGRYPDTALSLPSLRINSFSLELIESLPTKRKTGLTLAPEAGSERLRNIINKHIPQDELFDTVTTVFERGWTSLKLYFMVGLPQETDEDVEGIAELIRDINKIGSRVKGRKPQLRASVSTFVPKPHTPFQWTAQDTGPQLEHKQELLRNSLPRKGVKLSWTDTRVSLIEAVLSRGDRRLGEVIYRAWKNGCTFDAWDERFNFDGWLHAFDECGLDPDFYARRERPLDELLPWSHIDIGVSTAFLKREYEKSLRGETTPDCQYATCNACGFERRDTGCPSQ